MDVRREALGKQHVGRQPEDRSGCLRATRSRRTARHRGGWSRFGGEVAVALGFAATFVATGLGWVVAASDLRDRREAGSPIAYDPAAMDLREPRVWLVDGYNVLHAGVLRGRDRSQWWTESRRRELLDRAAGFAADAEVWIVFDGADDRAGDTEPPGPRCVFAASADDWLVDRVRKAEDPGEIAVVTADRQVAGRARGRGAHVVSPRDFLARCAT